MKSNIIRNNERELFASLKEKENYEKEIITSDDILYTSDFTIEKYSITNKEGDSGSLFLATNKKDKSDKYILKHEYYDCACNEYMYSKIGNSMGINITPVKLFYVDDKLKKFKSDFVCGIKYLEGATHIGIKNVLANKDNINNWEDYFRFRGMEKLFLEGDDIEVLLYNNYIYRIDTTDGFNIGHGDISYLAYDYEYEGINVRDYMEKFLLKKANLNVNHIVNLWQFDKNFFLKYYDKKYLKYYLEPFYWLDNINEEDIIEWTRILTYIYPDIVGEYYKVFLENLKKAVIIFLLEVEEKELALV